MKIVACDPGESFGYAVGHDNLLETCGTVELWEFVGALGAAFGFGQSANETLVEELSGAEHLVVEDWQLYPEAMASGALDWDKCRTARAIGAIEFICQAAGVACTIQPAKIKATAQAAGVENLYEKPLHENRHQNDAKQHFVYFNLKAGNPPVQWADAGATVPA